MAMDSGTTDGLEKIAGPARQYTMSLELYNSPLSAKVGDVQHIGSGWIPGVSETPWVPLSSWF